MSIKEFDGIIDASDPIAIRLRKDGETVIMSFVCQNPDDAAGLVAVLAGALDYGCVHFHTTRFGPRDEAEQAMEEKRGHRTH